jgi:hypothetical protein
MRGVIGQYLALAALACLTLPGLASGNPAATINAKATVSGGATATVTANISFARDTTVAKQSDATVGDDQAGTSGKNGEGEALGFYGRPSVIIIGDSRGQILNFLSDNYRPGGGISSFNAYCVLKGAENIACDKGPVAGKLENTLLINVGMTAADGIMPVDNKTLPSFDMSVVYQ